MTTSTMPPTYDSYCTCACTCTCVYVCRLRVFTTPKRALWFHNAARTGGDIVWGSGSYWAVWPRNVPHCRACSKLLSFKWDQSRVTSSLSS